MSGFPDLLGDTDQQDIFLFRFNYLTGAFFWYKEWGDGLDETLEDIAVSNDGSILYAVGSSTFSVTVGFTHPYLTTTPFILGVNYNGELQFCKTFTTDSATWPLYTSIIPKQIIVNSGNSRFFVLADGGQIVYQSY